MATADDLALELALDRVEWALETAARPHGETGPLVRALTAVDRALVPPKRAGKRAGRRQIKRAAGMLPFPDFADRKTSSGRVSSSLHQGVRSLRDKLVAFERGSPAPATDLPTDRPADCLPSLLQEGVLVLACLKSELEARRHWLLDGHRARRLSG